MMQNFKCSAISGFVVFIALFFAAPAVSVAHCGHHGDCSGCDDCGHCYGSSVRRAPESPVDSRVGRLQSLQGKVVETVYLPGVTPLDAIVEVRLRDGANTSVVRLGPTGFLKNSGLAVKEGDTINVSGYTVAAADGDLFIAEECTKDGKTVRLRSARGRPLW